ncbi:hypothetical protein JCM11641_006646 [Rhodosporidiobolus odoratus]
MKSWFKFLVILLVFAGIVAGAVVGGIKAKHAANAPRGDAKSSSGSLTATALTGSSASSSSTHSLDSSIAISSTASTSPASVSTSSTLAPHLAVPTLIESIHPAAARGIDHSEKEENDSFAVGLAAVEGGGTKGEERPLDEPIVAVPAELVVLAGSQPPPASPSPPVLSPPPGPLSQPTIAPWPIPENALQLQDGTRMPSIPAETPAPSADAALVPEAVKPPVGVRPILTAALIPLPPSPAPSFAAIPPPLPVIAQPTALHATSPLLGGESPAEELMRSASLATYRSHAESLTSTTDIRSLPSPAETATATDLTPIPPSLPTDTRPSSPSASQATFDYAPIPLLAANSDDEEKVPLAGPEKPPLDEWDEPPPKTGRRSWLPIGIRAAIVSALLIGLVVGLVFGIRAATGAMSEDPEESLSSSLSLPPSTSDTATTSSHDATTSPTHARAITSHPSSGSRSASAHFTESHSSSTSASHTASASSSHDRDEPRRKRS